MLNSLIFYINEKNGQFLQIRVYIWSAISFDLKCYKDPSTFNVSTISPVQTEIYRFHRETFPWRRVVRNPFAEDRQ